MVKRIAQSKSLGASSSGLFVRWFAKTGQTVKRYLSGDVTDG